MSVAPDVLWLNTSPSLHYFAKPLLCYLSSKLTIAQWDYLQTPDEASSLNVAASLLHEYLESCTQPVHLIGHSTGGLLGLLYARCYPEKVKSLTLLSVGVDPAVDWQSHYYKHRQVMDRQRIFNSMVYNLFGAQNERTLKHLEKLLKRDLDCSLSPHSLIETVSLPPGGVSVPLMICGGTDDIIIETDALRRWEKYLKPSDRIWLCPQGKHFFHFFQFQLLGAQMLNFWELSESTALYCSLNA